MWDGIIIGLFLAQIALLIAIGYFIGKIYKNPVRKTSTRVRSLIDSGRQLGALLQKNYLDKKARLAAIAALAQGLIADANRAVTQPEMRITYRSGFRALTTFRLINGLLGAGRKMFAAAPPPGPVIASPPRRSLAHRMGLISPAMERVGRAAPFLRSAYKTYRELRRRGIL